MNEEKSKRDLSIAHNPEIPEWLKWLKEIYQYDGMGNSKNDN